MGTDEMKQVGAWILDALQHADNDARLDQIHDAVRDFAVDYPVPGIG